MKTQILKSSILALILSTALSAKAHKEFVGGQADTENAQAEELSQEQLDALEENGPALFSAQENCEIEIVSHTTYTYRLIARQNVKSIRYLGPEIEFTVSDQICQGEEECVDVLLTGRMSLETGEKSVESLEIKHSQVENSDSNSDIQQKIEKKVEFKPPTPKPIKDMDAIVMNLGSEQTYSVGVVCTKSRLKDDEAN